MPHGNSPAAWSFRAASLAVVALLTVAGFAATVHAANNAIPLPRVSPHKHAPIDPNAPLALAPDDGDGGDATGDVSGDGTDTPPADAGADNPTGGAEDSDPAFDEPGAPAAAAGEDVGVPEPLTAAPIDLTGPTDIRPAGPGNYTLEAALAENGQPLSNGMTWHVFGGQPGSDGKLPLLKEATGGTVSVKLDPGTYLVHAAYDRAAITKRITVTDAPSGGLFVLNAGGMRLTALLGKEQQLPAGDVNFDIYAPDEGGADERSLLVPNAPAGHIIGLNAGTYHVVCRYGDANAIVRADIRVEPGKLTEATIYQKAARLTLKLVGEHGGEALADTAWSVMTPSGESVADSVGAFPSVVLAVGDYTAVAKHEGKIYESNFTVEAGLNRDVEVIAK